MELNNQKNFSQIHLLKKLIFKKFKNMEFKAVQLILEIEEDVHERKGSEIKKAIS